MATGNIEERLAEIAEAVAALKATATPGEAGSDASFALAERQRELESEQEKLRVVLQRVGERP